jgi:hypothetical protein
MRWRARAAAAGLVAATLAVVASACADRSDVASLGSEAPGEDSGAVQREVAQAMADCLHEADVPAVVKDLDDAANQAEVAMEEGEEIWQICTEVGCTMGGGAALSDSAREAALRELQVLGEGRDAAATETEPARPWLIIGADDLSDAWRTCAAATGYAEPTWSEDPGEEMRSKERTAQAGVAWAECARLNGYPATKDPAPPVADDWATTPTVALPADITLEQFDALLDACPPYDLEGHAAADDQAEADPELTEEEYQELVPADPQIGFDLPCANGSAAVCDDETWAKYNPYHQRVEERWNNYLAGRQPK